MICGVADHDGDDGAAAEGECRQNAVWPINNRRHLFLGNIMNTTLYNTKLAVCDRVEAHREVIRLSLDAIAAEVETALRAAGLDLAMFLVVPSSGNSILSIETPL